MNFDMKPIAVTASLDGTSILPDKAHPLSIFCNDLQQNRAPFVGPYWPTKNDLNIMSLWTCLEAKYTAVNRKDSGFEIILAQPSEHLVDVHLNKWIKTGKGGLAFPVRYEGNSAHLAVSFA